MKIPINLRLNEREKINVVFIIYGRTTIFLLNIWYEFCKVLSSMPTSNIKICYWWSYNNNWKNHVVYKLGTRSGIFQSILFDYCGCWWWCIRFQDKDYFIIISYMKYIKAKTLKINKKYCEYAPFRSMLFSQKYL